MSSPPLRLAPEIRDALSRGGAVVALETTLVTHGLPHPDGLEAAALLEAEVRAQGALPATVAVLDGAIVVGASPDDLARLAATPQVLKLNLSNLAAALANGRAGSTTVAATMLAARLAGIEVFSTGGIGGVHRDYSDSGDASADLAALARFPVAVVSAGAKAILDLPRTREALETFGVPVLGFRTDQFPRFYRRSSGLRVDARLDDVPALSKAVRAHFSIGGAGVLVCNPISEPDELPEESVNTAIAEALARARESGVTGRDVTPFLLEQLRVSTGGRSVAANLSLLRSNASLAGQLAVALSRTG